MSKTMSQMFIEGKYEDLVFVTMYSCGHSTKAYPMKFYFEPIDGDLEEYLDDEFRMINVTNVEVQDNVLVVTELVECQCTNCKRGKVYCKDMPETVGFETVTKYHGVFAYGGRTESDKESAVKHIEKILSISSYETCCSTEAIGSMGLVLDGKVITASNSDLNTLVDENGRYFYKDMAEDSLVFNAKDLQPDEYGINDELITINNKLKAIWIKTNCNNEIRVFAAMLAKKYNVEVIEVELTEADLEDLELLEMYKNRNM